MLNVSEAICLLTEVLELAFCSVPLTRGSAII